MTATAISAVSQPVEKIRPEGLWLRNQNWDTIFMTLSVLLVPLPYLFYLIGMEVLKTQGGIDFLRFVSPGLPVTPERISDVSRNGVNLFVALLVGGPHMYATFMRTALDEQFVKRYPMLIRSSIIIPIVVVSLAFLNLPLLLTVFFFWASIHVLHQVTYVVELYNQRALDDKKSRSAVSTWARMVDYALVLTCLFPIASLKISQGHFKIGTNDLTRVIPDFFKATEGRPPWFFVLMTSVFALAVLAFAIKTYREWKGGYIHWPKTVFIVITVAVACTMPALENLDTAFQGLNTWHSFQYLALTFYIIKLRQQAGELKTSAPLISRFAGGNNSLRLYGFSASMLLGSLLLGVVVYVMIGIVDPLRDANMRFDTSYYTAILCFLWIHYYHDHFLFTDFGAIERAAPAKA